MRHVKRHYIESNEELHVKGNSSLWTIKNKVSYVSDVYETNNYENDGNGHTSKPESSNHGVQVDATTLKKSDTTEQVTNVNTNYALPPGGETTHIPVLERSRSRNVVVNDEVAVNSTVDDEYITGNDRPQHEIKENETADLRPNDTSVIGKINGNKLSLRNRKLIANRNRRRGDFVIGKRENQQATRHCMSNVTTGHRLTVSDQREDCSQMVHQGPENSECLSPGLVDFFGNYSHNNTQPPPAQASHSKARGQSMDQTLSVQNKGSPTMAVDQSNKYAQKYMDGLVAESIDVGTRLGHKEHVLEQLAPEKTTHKPNGKSKIKLATSPGGSDVAFHEPGFDSQQGVGEELPPLLPPIAVLEDDENDDDLMNTMHEESQEDVDTDTANTRTDAEIFHSDVQPFRPRYRVHYNNSKVKCPRRPVSITLEDGVLHKRYHVYADESDNVETPRKGAPLGELAKFYALQMFGNLCCPTPRKESIRDDLSDTITNVSGSCEIIGPESWNQPSYISKIRHEIINPRYSNTSSMATATTNASRQPSQQHNQSIYTDDSGDEQPLPDGASAWEYMRHYFSHVIKYILSCINGPKAHRKKFSKDNYEANGCSPGEKLAIFKYSNYLPLQFATDNQNDISDSKSDVIRRNSKLHERKAPVTQSSNNAVVRNRTDEHSRYPVNKCSNNASIKMRTGGQCRGYFNKCSNNASIRRLTDEPCLGHTTKDLKHANIMLGTKTKKRNMDNQIPKRDLLCNATVKSHSNKHISHSLSRHLGDGSNFDNRVSISKKSTNGSYRCRVNPYQANSHQTTRKKHKRCVTESGDYSSVRFQNNSNYNMNAYSMNIKRPNGFSEVNTSKYVRHDGLTNHELSNTVQGKPKSFQISTQKTESPNQRVNSTMVDDTTGNCHCVLSGVTNLNLIDRYDRYNTFNSKTEIDCKLSGVINVNDTDGHENRTFSAKRHSLADKTNKRH